MDFMITNIFENISNKAGCKPNKIWVAKGSEFYNRSIKSWLQDNNIKIYYLSTQSRKTYSS